jgi:hypothetical protein
MMESIASGRFKHAGLANTRRSEKYSKTKKSTNELGFNWGFFAQDASEK